MGSPDLPTHPRRRPRSAAGCTVLLLGLLAAGCAAPIAEADARGAASEASTQDSGPTQVGVASFYARHFNGRRMANGRPFDPASDTVAHRTLPFGTVVRVTNLSNGRSTVGRVHDRGPWIRGRILDVSPRIARELDMMRSGLARVEVVPVTEVAEARD
jgi:rare lipoprotein A